MVFTIMGLRLLKALSFFLCVFNAHAFNWWQTADQKAYKAFEKKQYEKAMALFKRADWRGVAAFRQKNYAKAIQSFAEIKTSEGLYNLGTALAFQGDYENAIKVYHQVLSTDPEHEDAKYNLKILEEMQKKSQEKNAQQNQKQEKNQEQNSKEQENNKDEQQKQESQSKEQQTPKDKSANEKQKTKKQMHSQNQSSSKPNDTQESQWLKLIEDDPAGLLKQKFLRDYQREVEEGKI